MSYLIYGHIHMKQRCSSVKYIDGLVIIRHDLYAANSACRQPFKVTTHIQYQSSLTPNF